MTASGTEAAFRAALRDPDQPVPEGLTDGAGRPAGRRYAVYRNNVAVSLREALETGFPAVARLLGPTNFANVARDYQRTTPPRDPRMMFYGDGFPDFLSGVPALRHLGYLPDVARLELALRRAYHAADARALTAQILQGWDEARLMSARLRPVPAVQVLQSRWPALSVWRYALQGGSKPAAKPEDILVARPGYDPEPHLLPPGGATFLTALSDDHPLQQAVDRAGDEFDLAATLTLCLTTGALADPT